MVTPQAVSQSASGQLYGASRGRKRLRLGRNSTNSNWDRSSVVPGRVTQNGAVWRIQLGPFASKAEASTLQQRLQTEAQLQSFITTAQ